MVFARPTDDRPEMAAEIFTAADPIADEDDRAAAPLMEQVIELQPAHPQALYHLGMANLALGHTEIGRVQIKKFLLVYPEHDAFRRRAQMSIDRVVRTVGQ